MATKNSGLGVGSGFNEATHNPRDERDTTLNDQHCDCEHNDDQHNTAAGKVKGRSSVANK